MKIMNILKLSHSPQIKKGAPLWYFGLNQTETFIYFSLNNSEKHYSKFQKKQTANKNNSNFEIKPLQPPLKFS